MWPFVILCAGLWLAALAVIWVADTREQLDRILLEALDSEAADHDEPSRREVEAQSETPIFDE